MLDTALALNATAGPDPRDWRSLPAEPRDYTIGLDEGVRGWRIGLSLDFGHVKADPEVRELVAAAARRFEALGAHVEDVGPLIEPLQNSFEPLWIGSFAMRLRQIPTSSTASSIPASAPRPRRAWRSRWPTTPGPTRPSRSSRATWRCGTRNTTCCWRR